LSRCDNYDIRHKSFPFVLVELLSNSIHKRDDALEHQLGRCRVKSSPIWISKMMHRRGVDVLFKSSPGFVNARGELSDYLRVSTRVSFAKVDLYRDSGRPIAPSQIPDGKRSCDQHNPPGARPGGRDQLRTCAAI